MADVILGDVVARLRVDSTQFEQALTAAQQRLAQFQQTLNQTTQQQSADRQATQQLAQAMAQLTQAIQAQTQAFTGARTSANTFNQTLNQTKTTLNQTNQTFNQANTTLNQITNTFNQTTNVVKQATAATQQAGGAFRNMVQIAGGIGVATGISALVGQMKDLAVSTVDVGQRMEQLRASLSALGGGQTAGVQQFQQLMETAQRLGIALEPLARGWRQLTAAATQANLPLADQQRLLEALAKEGRRVGASNEEVGRAITAVAQIASKGKVSMEELRQQLGEALPTAMAAAAKGFGVTTAEVEKLVETGVSFVPFAKALTRGFEEMQAGSKGLGDTAGAAFTRLGNAILGLKDAIANSGLNQYLVTVTNNVRELVEWVTRLAKGTATTVPVGPQLQDIGLSDDQVRQLQKIDEALNRARAGVAGARTEQRREELGKIVTELERQREALMEGAKAAKTVADEQSRVTAETNKAASALEKQDAFVEELRKKIEAVRKEEAAFRQQAANAPNVLGDPRGTPEQQETFARERQRALEKSVTDLSQFISKPPAGVTVPPELRQEVRGLDSDYKRLGDTIDSLKEKERERRRAETEAEQARKKAAREAQQDAEQYQEAIDKVRISQVRQQEEALATLARLAASYTQTAEARDIDTATKAAAVLKDTELNEQAQAYLKTIQAVADIEGQVAELRRQAELSAPAGRAAIALAGRTGQFEQSVQDQLERLRLPREERLEDRLRDQARKQGVDITPETEAQLKAISQQERFNQLMEVSQRLGDTVAQNLTNGLLNVASGAERVGDAFKNMAKAILDSTAQLLVSEGFKLLLSIGVRAVSAYFSPATPAVGGGTSFASAGTGSGFLQGTGGSFAFQHGGVVNRPTMALIGENAANNPEYVLNRQQMGSLMNSARQAGPSAGGQAMGGANLTVINVADRAEGERRAAQERAMGRTVVVNYVLDELSAGSGSRIAQVLRAGQR